MSPLRSLALVAVLLCVFAFHPGRAQGPKKAEKPAPSAQKWTIDDIVSQESAADFRFSPDERHLVWIRTAPNKDRTAMAANVMRTDLVEGRDVELTRGSDTFSKPRWSRDGEMLAFLSDRPIHPRTKGRGREAAEEEEEHKPQLWVMGAFGGEPWHLTEGKRGVLSFSWAGPEDLVFAAQEDETWREKSLEEKKDTTIVVEDEKHEPPVRLFRVNVKSLKITRLTENTDRIETVAVSPDGRYAATQHSRSLRYTYDNRVKPEVYLYDLHSGERKRVFADPKMNLSAFVWAPDGAGFYATNEHNSMPETNQAGVTELWYFDLESGKERQVDLDWPNGLATQPDNEDAPGIVPVRGGFVALLASGARPRLAHYVRDGDTWKRRQLQGEHADHVFGFQVAASGKKLVYATSTAATPTQWYHAPLDGDRIGEAKRVVELNAGTASLPRPRTEVIRWKGAYDEEVEGILYYPVGHEPGRKYPLIVMIHGGPASLDYDSWDESWSYAAMLYCQKGAAVLKPNYHGSSNYGLKWLESITRGKYGEPELIDIEKGVDHLIAKGLADPAKLALLGWSNGAILTNLMVVRTTRYKAAVSGAGNVEYVSDWANCEFGDAFDRYYLGKSPLQDPQLYQRKSPFYQMEKVRTPTLIFVGSEDRTVPTQQGWVQYRALQQLAKTDVRFVLFPGEKHSLKKLEHQKRKLAEEMAWFDRYLFQDAKPANESLRRESPLAWLLERQAAAKANGRYGREVKGVLVPETVEYHGIAVGRFEVTAAQYAAFDPNWRVEPGKENHPAAGITFEQAQAYCDWLSRKTGEKYRLPNQEEADKLYTDSATDENTLDYWAGYSVNPDDAVRLREKISALPGKAPLLREVGSFRGEGTDKQVFDLGGNVAEWVADKDGKGVPMGGSADQPADPKHRSAVAAPEYRGLRVVRGE
jgi:dipeptidyl aminopeptidase/acylaminoacyl peptidase